LLIRGRAEVLIMENRSITAYFMFAVVLILGGYEVFVAATDGESWISQWMADSIGNNLILWAVFWILVTHFSGWVMRRRIVRCPACGSLVDVNHGKVIGK